MAFLTAEKFGVLNGTFSFGSLAVALFGLILLTRNDWMQILGLFLLLGYVGYVVYFGVVSRFQKRGKKAERILEKVMKGELTDPDSVRREWYSPEEGKSH